MLFVHLGYPWPTSRPSSLSLSSRRHMRRPWCYLLLTTTTLLVVLLSIYASGYMRIGSSIIRPTTSTRLNSFKNLIPSSYLFDRPVVQSRQPPSSSKTFSTILSPKPTIQSTMPFPPPNSKPKSTSATPGTRKPASELSPSEQKQYDELAVMMTRYHDHFKHVWEFVYTVSYWSACLLDWLPKSGLRSANWNFRLGLMLDGNVECGQDQECGGIKEVVE